jgi:hypothetical protein
VSLESHDSLKPVPSDRFRTSFDFLWGDDVAFPGITGAAFFVASSVNRRWAAMPAGNEEWPEQSLHALEHHRHTSLKPCDPYVFTFEFALCDNDYIERGCCYELQV